ncbi:MAG: hypothetical protein OEV40_03660, partial [Acidimicrobiia bacterium]|nr:hypothetical protein [Acidimicrobiia bacterium]
MVALLAALALLLAACGSDEDDTGTATESEESSDTSAAETEDSSDASAPETEDSSESDEAMEDDEESTDISAAEAEESSESDDATEAEAGDALPIELGEWFVGAPEGITAGTLTFTVENVGENPHAFAI